MRFLYLSFVVVSSFLATACGVQSSSDSSLNAIRGTDFREGDAEFGNYKISEVFSVSADLNKIVHAKVGRHLCFGKGSRYDSYVIWTESADIDEKKACDTAEGHMRPALKLVLGGVTQEKYKSEIKRSFTREDLGHKRDFYTRTKERALFISTGIKVGAMRSEVESRSGYRTLGGSFVLNNGRVGIPVNIPSRRVPDKIVREEVELTDLCSAKNDQESSCDAFFGRDGMISIRPS